MDQNERKVAIVTGGSKGIGRAIALELARNQYHVIVNYKSDTAGAEETVSLMEKEGFSGEISQFDVSDVQESKSAVDQIISRFKNIDVLVNNAGITRDTLLMRMTEDQWDSVIAVNLKSVFNLTKAVIPVMLKQKNGSIVNMSSVVGVSGNAGQSNYSASKAGIIGFTKSVAKEVGSRNIRCNGIAPGFILTEMTEKLPKKKKNEWAGKIPLRRGGTPEDVANTALYLASDLASYVTGQIIHVCGGMLT